MSKKVFMDDEFDKVITIGDELIFDKPEFRKLRVDLTWIGTDLDVCAFMLGEDGMIHQKEDLVYFNSKRRWKPKRAFNDPNFSPLEGKVSLWEDAKNEFVNPRKWMEATLPISADNAVIGSWDDMDDNGGPEELGESMHVLLDEVDTRKYKSIVFAATVSMEKIKQGETFGNAKDPVVTIYNAETEEVIAEYKLNKEFPGKDAVCFGKMEFNSNSFLWNFVPMANAFNGGMMYLATEVYN